MSDHGEKWIGKLRVETTPYGEEICDETGKVLIRESRQSIAERYDGHIGPTAFHHAVACINALRGFDPAEARKLLLANRFKDEVSIIDCQIPGCEGFYYQGEEIDGEENNPVGVFHNLHDCILAAAVAAGLITQEEIEI